MCLEAPGPVTACNSRPTPIGQTCRDVSTYFFSFLLYLHLQECLQAPGPATACNSRPTPIGQTCRDVSRLVSLFTSTNFLSNSSITLTKSYYLRTHTTVLKFTGNLHRHCTHRLSHTTQAQFTQKHLDQNKASTPLQLFFFAIRKPD